MVIYLDQMSPPGSSNLPESRRAALCFLFGLASNGVYMCPVCYQPGGSLLHCLSTLTSRSEPETEHEPDSNRCAILVTRHSPHTSARKPFRVSELTRPVFQPSVSGSELTRYISVALALESPPPDVIRHPAL